MGQVLAGMFAAMSGMVVMDPMEMREMERTIVEADAAKALSVSGAPGWSLKLMFATGDYHATCMDMTSAGGADMQLTFEDMFMHDDDSTYYDEWAAKFEDKYDAAPELWETPYIGMIRIPLTDDNGDPINDSNGDPMMLHYDLGRIKPLGLGAYVSQAPMLLCPYSREMMMDDDIEGISALSEDAKDDMMDMAMEPPPDAPGAILFLTIDAVNGNQVKVVSPEGAVEVYVACASECAAPAPTDPPA